MVKFDQLIENTILYQCTFEKVDFCVRLPLSYIGESEKRDIVMHIWGVTRNMREAINLTYCKL